MTIKAKKSQKGIVLKESAEITTESGQLRNDGTKLKAYIEGAEREVVTSDQTQDLDNKTLNNPTIDGTVSGTALDTDVNTNSSNKIPTTQAVKAYADSIAGATNLNDLNDVDTTGITDTQVLSYNSTGSNWIPADSTAISNPTVDTATIANNQTTPAALGSLIFNKNVYVSGVYDYTLYRKAGSTELVEIGLIYIIANSLDGTIDVNLESGIGNAGLSVSVLQATGQVLYTTNDLAGADYFGEMEIKQRSLFAIPENIPVTVTQMAVTQQPTNVDENTVISPAITVELRDNANQLVTTASNDITVSLIGTGNLTGTLTKSPVSGVVTFDDLQIDTDQVGAQLQFTSSGLPTIQSSSFDVIEAAVATSASWEVISGSATTSGTSNETLSVSGTASARLKDLFFADTSGTKSVKFRYRTTGNFAVGIVTKGDNLSWFGAGAGSGYVYQPWIRRANQLNTSPAMAAGTNLWVGDGSDQEYDYEFRITDGVISLYRNSILLDTVISDLDNQVNLIPPYEFQIMTSGALDYDITLLETSGLSRVDSWLSLTGSSTISGTDNQILTVSGASNDRLVNTTLLADQDWTVDFDYTPNILAGDSFISIVNQDGDLSTWAGGGPKASFYYNPGLGGLNSVIYYSTSPTLTNTGQIGGGYTAGLTYKHSIRNNAGTLEFWRDDGAGGALTLLESSSDLLTNQTGLDGPYYFMHQQANSTDREIEITNISGPGAII